jgi:hypothetical protein
MTDLKEAFHRLDANPVPDMWTDIERRAVAHRVAESPSSPRTRWAAGVTAAVVAVASIGFAVVALRPGPAERPPSFTSSASFPETGQILGVTPFSVRETELYAASESSLFVIVIPPGNSPKITVMRIAEDGSTESRGVPFDLEYFLMSMTAGPEGVFAGTAVVKRFAQEPDALIRIDPSSLSITARVAFPASVAPLQVDRGLWASFGDGRVLRLDPQTLAIEASARVVPAASAAMSEASISRPAFGLGSLWVVERAGSRRTLLRLDPTTLAILTETALPSRGLDNVVADGQYVYVTGLQSFAQVSSDGSLSESRANVPGLDGLEPHGSDLVGLVGGSEPALVIVAPSGDLVTRTALADAGSELALSGQDVWFLGKAQGTFGIIHARLQGDG